MNTILNVLLFCVGWISGGGILTFIAVTLLEFVFGASGYNTSFVSGCLWGTFGVLGGVFMVRVASKNQITSEPTR